MKTTTKAVHVRWIIRADTETILDIENASFHAPMTREELTTTLTHRDIIGMVAELNEQVVGYMIYRLARNHIELLTLAVHPDFRRQRIGTEMMQKCKSKLNRQRRCVICYVPDTNLGGHLFMKANHMTATHVARGYFGQSDGYRFVFEAWVEE